MSSHFSDWRRRLLPDPILGWLGVLVFLSTLIVYLKTVQRTVPFWDCGEFITCAHVLGVPHPPGSPLFVMIGRIFSLLPIVSDISHRVNLISVFSSALAATAAFFVLARLITLWYSDRYPDRQLGLSQRLSIYAGSLSGSLFLAFSNTHWSNAVEAEVYGFSMFLMIACLWLTLVWAEQRDDPKSDRYLIGIAYIGFLSIGVHMTVFLVLPPIFLAVILLSERLRRDWRLWAASVVMFLATGDIRTFLWSITGFLALSGILACYRRWGWVGLGWTLLIWGGGVIGAAVQGEAWPVFIAALIWGLGVIVWAVNDPAWRLTFSMLVLSLLGFSVHLYIPVRAHQNPAINENDPKSWETFRGFLERKQYGSESMYQRALTRRAQWVNQFGQHERMGFWGFFDRQYGFNDRAFLPIFLLGLAGIYQLTRRRRTIGILFIALLLITSVGLIWYMNFADGTKYNAATQDAYLEVRDRDYFFTPAFILFAMAIGLGGAALIGALGGGSRVWPVLGAAVITLLPLRALQANYFINDRSRNTIAYDYAYNILMSADNGAILFTNGDNDTFPVWCLQEAYGIRRDVRIVNLSLLNTNWYIKQLKHYHDVPMDYTDDQIDHLVHFRTPDGKLHRVQDQMIDEILSANRGKQTINFAVTVTAGNRRYKDQPLEKHLVMMGLAYRLVPEEGDGMVDLDLLQQRLNGVFQYRGINDSTIYKDENSDRMVSNYSSGFIYAADTLRRAGRMDEAATLMQRDVAMAPRQWEPYVYLTQLYGDLKRPEPLESLLVQAAHMPTERERIEVNIGNSFRKMGNKDRAVAILDGILVRHPDYDPAFKTLVQLYYDAAEYDTLVTLLDSWTKKNPKDTQSQDLLAKVRTLAAQPKGTPVGADSAKSGSH
ncbi:MAG: DUF2723 domain-containing protein [candidate division Zixibacteria bacterium]|nr:DUF2723 domain-containing protein [candidate division Zixibacteria bacterium]